MIRNDISNNDYIPGIPAHLRKSRISNNKFKKRYDKSFEI